MTLLFLQFGNYAESWHRFRQGGEENYRDQRRSVSRVEALSAYQQVIVVSCGESPHDEQLTPSLRSIRISEADSRRWKLMSELVGVLAPTKAVSCSPNKAWHLALARREIPTLPLYADYLQTRTIRDKFRAKALSRALTAGRCQVVANHSLQASKSLRALHYSDEDIIPWEFRRLAPFHIAKTHPGHGPRRRLMFAGAVQATKGVGDCIDASRRLASRGIDVELVVAGNGDITGFKALSDSAGVADRVRFLGSIPLDQVGQLMRSSDIVIVPSRHEFAEGLPNVIYEALASRTPLVCSDHPAFAPRLPHRKAAMHFVASDSESLADAICELLSSPSLYANLSENSAAALDALYVGIERLELIDLFVGDPRLTTGWHRRIPNLKSILGSEAAVGACSSWPR